MMIEAAVPRLDRNGLAVLDDTMSVGDAEIPLTKGNVNPAVVRIADTVRRTIGPSSETVHRLLLHLERTGFTSSPQFLGIDEQGREVLSLIKGSAELPRDLWENDAAVVTASKMLRKLHDASQGFGEWQPGDWACAYPDVGRHEVICHNDFAPYNMIFENGLPVGIIDFDLAGPGPRIRDLAYWLTPLSFSSADLAERTAREIARGAPRLRLLREAYGIGARSGLLEMVSEILHHMGSKAAAVSMIGPDAAKRLEDGGHFAHWQQEAGAFDANASLIPSSLR